MSQRIASTRWLIAIALLSSAAGAKSPWVGRWFAVPEESRRSATSFTLTTLPGGRLRLDAGWQAFVLDRGGQPTPELLQPHALVQVEALTPNSFRYVEIIHDRPVERVEQTLSPDGSRLVGRRTVIKEDGRESGRDIVSVRVGRGDGLAGAWRELPPAADAAHAVSAQKADTPVWDISEDAAGIMTWRVVPTGEVLKGAADGRQYASAGPRQPEGRTFSIKVLAPRHLRFFIYDNGRLVEQTDDTPSADGKRWTDVLWSPAYPNEKDRLVYRRE